MVIQYGHEQKVYNLGELRTKTVLYHNHIPKTGGLSLRKSLELAGFDLPENQEKLINQDVMFVSEHFGNNYFFKKDKLEEFTFLRNPVNRIVSNWVMGKKDYFNIGSDLSETQELLINRLVKDFESWWYKDVDKNIKYNYQAKNICHPSIKKSRAGKFFEDNDYIMNGFRIPDKEVTLEKTMERLNSMLFVGSTEKFDRDMKQLLSILSDRFDLALNPDIPNVFNNKEQLSKDVRDNLTQELIDDMIEKNEIDYHIWQFANNK